LGSTGYDDFPFEGGSKFFASFITSTYVDAFYASGYSALFSFEGKYLNIALAAQREGKDYEDIAAAIGGVYDSKNPEYGANFKGAFKAFLAKTDCPNVQW
jgi:hypothetical protein